MILSALQEHIFFKIAMRTSPKIYLLTLFFVIVTACAGCSDERVIEPIGFTEHEKSWLESHPQIRLAPEENYPPFIFVDPKGGIKGISADYISLQQGSGAEVVVPQQWFQPT